MTGLGFRVATAQIGAEDYVLAVAGEVDSHTSEPLEQELAALFDEGAETIVIDLLGVTFIDSAALGVLTRAAKRVVGNGGELVLVCDDPRLLRTFEITGLDRSFRIERTLSDAVTNLVDLGNHS
jgi:anti-sigma B factor antagonist